MTDISPAAPLLLVGSIPYDTTEKVFETFGRTLGPYLGSVPDGEVGPRAHWISRVHYQVFAGHQNLEITRRPRPDGGVERLNPHDASDGWRFRVREDVERVRFGNPGWRLGFARDAINSYFVFKTYREKGILPAHLRFQVSMPMVNSTIPPRVFPDLADLGKMREAYTEALGEELQTILDRIPPADLAIQWDCATEVQDVNGALPEFDGDAVERNLGQIRALSAPIPPEVKLGYHFCFGTLGGWPRFQPDGLGPTVAYANAVVAASGRQVDWIHIPTTETVNETFYSTLAELEPAGAQVYLGLIHNMASFERRLALSRRFLPDFGIAAYCGFGRTPREKLPDILDEHLKALEILH